MNHSPSARSVGIAAVFHALGDPTRRVIVEQLCKRPLSASLLAAPLGITVAAVVQHLSILEVSGLIRSEKVGRVRTCRIEPSGMKVLADWIGERQALWEHRLDRLKAVLEEDQSQPQEPYNKSNQSRSRTKTKRRAI